MAGILPGFLLSVLGQKLDILLISSYQWRRHILDLWTVLSHLVMNWRWFSFLVLISRISILSLHAILVGEVISLILGALLVLAR